MSDPKEAPTEPAMGAITDRQLLVDMAQKLSGLVTTVKDGFESSAARDLELVHRVTGLEQWRNSVDERLNSNSLRASEPSKHDLEAQAALAAETAAREALAEKVDALDKKQDVQTVIMSEVKSAVVTFWKTPTGTLIKYIVTGAIIGWALRNNVPLPPGFILP